MIVSQKTVGDPCRFSVFLTADLSGLRLRPRPPRLLGERRVEGLFRGARRRARDRVFGDFFLTLLDGGFCPLTLCSGRLELGPAPKNRRGRSPRMTPGTRLGARVEGAGLEVRVLETGVWKEGGRCSALSEKLYFPCRGLFIG